MTFLLAMSHLECLTLHLSTHGGLLGFQSILDVPLCLKECYLPTFDNSIRMPPSLSASVFRRGGTKQELFDSVQQPQGQQLVAEEEPALVQELDQLLTVLQAPKAGHDLSAAIWRPLIGAAELVLVRKDTGQPMGFRYRRRRYLHIEEAVFLVDRADLLLFVEQEEDDLAAPRYASASGSSDIMGAPQPFPRHRLLSVQECFELMELCGVSMDRYIVYSTLSRSGYLVMRYPSCWLLDPMLGGDLGQQLTPKQVWGHGAWARAPASPAGAPPSQPGQPGRLNNAAAAVDWVQRQCARAVHMKAVHQGQPPACFTPDMEQELLQPGVGGAQVRGSSKQDAQQCVGEKHKLDQHKQHHQDKAKVARPDSKPQQQQQQQQQQEHTQPEKQQKPPKQGKQVGQQHGMQAGQQQGQEQGQDCRPRKRQKQPGPSAGQQKQQQQQQLPKGEPRPKVTLPAPPPSKLQGHRGWYPLNPFSPATQVCFPQPTTQAPPHSKPSPQIQPLPAQPSPHPPAHACMPLPDAALQGVVASPQPQSEGQGSVMQPTGPPTAHVLPEWSRGGGSAGPSVAQQALQDCLASPPGHAVAYLAGPSLRARLPHLKPFAAPSMHAHAHMLPGGWPSKNGHLVYDVYKPGARVSRGRMTFPTVMCHIAISSGRPPSLQEMWMAGTEALNEQCPVKWVAVEGGVMTLYQLGQASVTSLIS